MLDITSCEQLWGDYEGSELKFAIDYNGKKYMVKKPDPARKSDLDLSYINNQYSEDLGCKIFASIDIPVQKTFLAKFNDNGKLKIVVACQDFREPEELLFEADKLAKSFVNSQDMNKARLEDIQKILNEVQTKLSNDENAENRFWDTFVVDAFIGNKDRHMGNWGFLSKDSRHLKLAPVYDCGSSLSSLMSDEQMEKALKDDTFKTHEYNIASCMSKDGKRIFYHEMFNNPPKALQDAILRIVPKINLNKINAIINQEEGMSEIRKNYIRKSIELRYERILEPAFTRLKLEQYKTRCSSVEAISELIKEEVANNQDLKYIEKLLMKSLSGTHSEKRKQYIAAINLAGISDVKRHNKLILSHEKVTSENSIQR